MKQERLKTVQAQALLENSRINFLLSSPLSEIVQESRTNLFLSFPQAQALLENSRINFLLSSPLSEIVQESRTNLLLSFPQAVLAALCCNPAIEVREQSGYTSLVSHNPCPISGLVSTLCQRMLIVDAPSLHSQAR